MSDTPSKKALILSAIFEDIRAGKYFGPVALDKAYEAGRDAASADLSAALEAVRSLANCANGVIEEWRDSFDDDSMIPSDHATLLLEDATKKHAPIIALAKGGGG